MANEINVPQLILVLLLSGVAIRYFFFSSTAPTTQRRVSSASAARAREADVERIQQMFPQIPRRQIMWNLQRDGGNVAATTERVLSGRGLEEPPQSFQPPLPAPSSNSTAAAPPAPSASKPVQPDLITRYNLASKIAAGEVEIPAEPEKKKQAWSQNKGERQALLQKRREEMILAARKKMEEKLRAEQAAQSTPSSS